MASKKGKALSRLGPRRWSLYRSGNTPIVIPEAKKTYQELARVVEVTVHNQVGQTVGAAQQAV
jgi:hypothetical protein